MTHDTPADRAREMDELEQAARDYRPDHPTRARGPQARRVQRAQQAAATKQAISLRLDVDVLERVRALAKDGSYQTLINRALAQWCDAMELGQLLDPTLARLEAAVAQLEEAAHHAAHDTPEQPADPDQGAA